MRISYDELKGMSMAVMNRSMEAADISAVTVEMSYSIRTHSLKQFAKCRFIVAFRTTSVGRQARSWSTENITGGFLLGIRVHFLLEYV